MSKALVRASIIGSFRKYYREVLAAIDVFHSAGIGMLSPEGTEVIDPSDEFVRFVSDPQESTDAQIQALAVWRILSSDFVYVVCPTGYLGRTTCYEIGLIHLAGIPVYFSAPPLDLPVLLTEEAVIDPRGLSALVAQVGLRGLKGGLVPVKLAIDLGPNLNTRSRPS